MYFFPFTNEEIYNFVAKLKNKKSVGLDGVNVKIFKAAAQIITPYLKTAYKKCISEDVFPKSMKIAKVVPVFKDGEKNLTSNYRPISILGNLSKIFEKVIHKRLMNSLEKVSILSENQYGFKKKERLLTSTYAVKEKNSK